MHAHFSVPLPLRRCPLQVEPEGLAGGYGDVQPGDCVVAFSRRDIYAIKQVIEQETKHRACVVYGALPPETRRQQAKLFNEPGGWHHGALGTLRLWKDLGCCQPCLGWAILDLATCAEPDSPCSCHIPPTSHACTAMCRPADNAYRVLVASDAVGMGLNLNIRRIIFHSIAKNDGAAPLAGGAALAGHACMAKACCQPLPFAPPSSFSYFPRLHGPFCCAGTGKRVPVSVSMLKQIAGRAGRRSSQWNKGLATCLSPSDVPRLQEAISVSLPAVCYPPGRSAPCAAVSENQHQHACRRAAVALLSRRSSGAAGTAGHAKGRPLPRV